MPMSPRSLEARSLQTRGPGGPRAERGLPFAGTLSVLAQPHLQKHQAHSDDQAGSNQQKPHELTGPAESRGAYRSGDDQERGRPVDNDARPPGHR